MIRNHQLSCAIKTGVGRCQICLQGCQPFGDICKGRISIAILIEKLIIGINFKAKVIDPIQYGVNQVQSTKPLIGTIILNRVEASSHTILIIAVENFKGGSACCITA